VLYSSKAGAWKITDFGLTAQGESQKANTTVYARGTSGYRAPEMIRGEHQTFTNKVDIWALGCLLFEVFSGKKAFAGDGAALEYCLLGQKLQFMPSEDQLEWDALNEILGNMLEVEPLARKSAEHFHTEFLSFLLQLQRA
jgi:NIMA (never in mitosis gene a)-related kinase